MQSTSWNAANRIMAPATFLACSLKTVFPLVSLNTVQHMAKMVFITGEVDKLPSLDSSVTGHDAAYRIGIDTQIYRLTPPKPQAAIDGVCAAK